MPIRFPRYVFGIHGHGAWMDAVQAAGRQGWVLISEAIGSDPKDGSSEDYTLHASRGFGVIVRLNNGYDDGGTIPHSSHYRDFAQRCKNWVERSKGANIWIIGNETNLAAERPGGRPNGQVITPQLYAQCYRLCRDTIKSAPGHANDLVLVSGVGPWNSDTLYPGNEKGDWVRYFTDILDLLKPNCDGITIHTYTHGSDPSLIFSDQPDTVFPQYHYHFRAYRDLMRAIPRELKGLPVFITEAQPDPQRDNSAGWQTDGRGWVSNAYQEVNDWNSNPANQPIQALILFRWKEGTPAWSIADKPWVLDDFAAAIRNEYRVRMPNPAPLPPPRLYRATFLGSDSPSSIVANSEALADLGVRNDSNFVWKADSSSLTPVRLGYRWYDGEGREVPARAGLRTPLPRDIQPGQMLTLTNARVVAPPSPDTYTLRWDMLEEGVTWFGDAGGTPYKVTVEVVSASPGPLAYAAKWVSTNIPDTFPRDASTNASLTVRNDGTKTWQAGPSTGSGHPVRLGVRWYRVPTNSEVLLRDVVRVGLPRDVGPGDSVTLTLPVLAPFTPGVYNLLFDLIEEGVQEFRQAGSKPYLQTVTVTAPPYYASFISAPVPDKLAIDQVKSVRFTVRNDGSKTWLAAPATGSGAAPVRLAYTWLNAQNESVPLHASRDLRASLPRDIGPGETCDLNVELLAPDRPGSFTLHCDLLEEGVTSFADMGSPPLRASVQVQGAQDFQVTFGDPLTILPPATPFSMNVKIRNDGNKTWYTTGPHPVKLGSHWFDARNDGARTSDTVVPVALDIRNPLPFDVAPGQEAVFSAQTFAPDKPGRYRLQWSLVVEGMLWFYDLSARVLELPVQVTPVGAPLPPPTASILSSGVQPTMAYRAALKLTQPFTAMEHDTPAVISLSLRNDGARTWAAGGDSPVYVGTQWFRGSEPVPVQPDLRTALPEDVQPGQAITFGAQVYPPETPGNYTLRLDLIEGEVWFADVKTSIPLDLMVEVKQAAPRGLTISTSHNPEAAHLAIDGNPHTTWDSGQPMEPGMWVQCDLGARRTIDALFITSGGRGFPAGCEAQVSADGFAWAAVGRRERNWGDVTFTFAPLAARYIRIAQTGRSLAGEPWQIAAIAVHEAAPWQAVASHNPNLAGLAFDHNPDTLWTSAAPQEPGMTFTLDMGAQHTITGLTLENGPRPEYPQGYRLMIATDGEDWQEVAHSPETGNWSPLSLTFDPVPVRYIRIECTAASRWQPWSISQIWVLRSVGEWEALAVGVAR